MKKLMMSLFWLVYQSSFCFADDTLVPQPYLNPPLDDVSFQLSARDWVSTQSALVQININATLSNTDMVKARDEMMRNLSKIASADWHLTQFERSQDSSGLEKLNVLAEARVPQTNLADIYAHAKAVSHPGVNFTVASIEFKPSLEELQMAKTKLRARLYQDVQDELARLNKVYTEQHYSLHHLWFVEGDLPMPLMDARMKSSTNVMLASVAASSPVSVSNELKMSVMVELSSNRKGVA